MIALQMSKNSLISINKVGWVLIRRQVSIKKHDLLRDLCFFFKEAFQKIIDFLCITKDHRPTGKLNLQYNENVYIMGLFS